MNLLPLLVALLCLPVPALAAPPAVTDMHLHYKWSQRDVTTPEQALEQLQRQNIVLGVVIGTPAPLALELEALAPERIVSIWSPYRDGGDWLRWVRDPSVPERARAALAGGGYQGIGELHLIGGFMPRIERAGVLHSLMQLAAEFDVPIMLHTEFSRPDYLLALCQRYPDTRIVWAHSGAILKPSQVEQVLDSCDNVWGGLGARDPWRFVNNPITDEQGQLLAEWRTLLLHYPERFMAGSDPVWPVEQLDSWDMDDTGWHELGRFWDFHRGWLAQLPREVALRIGCVNTYEVYGRRRKLQCESTRDAPGASR